MAWIGVATLVQGTCQQPKCQVYLRSAYLCTSPERLFIVQITLNAHRCITKCTAPDYAANEGATPTERCS